MPPTTVLQTIVEKSLRRRKLLLGALFWLAIPAFVMTGGLVGFQFWQFWQFLHLSQSDTFSWLTLSSLGGIATLAVLAFLLHLLLKWRSAEAALIAYVETLCRSHPPLPCRLEIPDYQKKGSTRNMVALFGLQFCADAFSTAHEETLVLSALNMPLREGGECLLWQGELSGKAIRAIAFGKSLLTGYPVTEHTFRQHLMRQAKIASLGGTLGGMMIVGLMTGYTGLEALEIQDRLQYATASSSWPTAPGVVLASEIRDTHIRRGKREVDAYRAYVRYSYVVDGKTLEGDKLHFAYEPDTRRELADALTQRYRVGTSVAVLHHPHRPWISTLEPGHAAGLGKQRDDRIVLLFLLPLTLLIIAGMLAFIVPLGMRSQESRCLAFIRRSSSQDL